MFEAGEKIIYPMHGAGEIEAIEERDSPLGVEYFYIIRIPKGDIKIRVAEKSISTLGVRRAEEKGAIQSCFTKRGVKEIPHFSNWNKLYKNNLEKIKTGRFAEMVEVFFELSDKEEKKGLSSGEKRLLQTVKQIIISELIISYQIDDKEAEDLLANFLMCC